MLDIAWPELAVIGVVALVAIGPKDLPKVMRTLGQWAGKARHMMQDIQRSFEQLNYETEIAEKMKREEQAAAAPPPSQTTSQAAPQPTPSPSPQPAPAEASHDATPN